MTTTAFSALTTALVWVEQVVQIQPFGEVSLVVQIQNGNIVLIKKSIQETEKP